MKFASLWCLPGLLAGLSPLAQPAVVVPAPPAVVVPAKPALPAELLALQQKAQAGDAQSQWLLSDAFAFGRNTVIDNNASLQWAQKAAAQQHPKGIFQVASQLRAGIAIARDVEKSNALLAQALPALKKLAEAGDAYAAWMVGDIIFDGTGVPQDKF